MSKVRNIKALLLLGVLLFTSWAQTTTTNPSSSPYPSDSAVAGIGQDLPSALGGSSSIGGENQAASTTGGDLAYDAAALDKLSQ